MEVAEMIALRRGTDRGHANHGWLESWHSFSFGDYVDPEHMGYSSLRVLNEDIIAPGGGFPTHPHRDMEIVTYILDGGLRHQDSMGNGTVIGAGEVQRMTAGTGVRHSEFNASDTEPVHLVQIWIEPVRRALAPGYEQKRFTRQEKQGRLRTVASPDGRGGSLTIHQDAFLYAVILGRSELATHFLAQGRRAYVHVARGAAQVNGHVLAAGDAVKLEQLDSVTLRAAADSEAELLLFDLP